MPDKIPPPLDLDYDREREKEETTLPIVKSAHVLMRADARKRCRFAPKNAFIPRTGAEIAHGNVPRTTQKAKKERKTRTGTAILFY